MLHKAALTLAAASLLAVATVATVPTHAQSFDDRRAQLAAQTELVNAEMQLQDALRRQAGASVGNMPQVLSIFGIDGKLSARVLQSNGVVSNYREGDSIRPGMVIAAITQRAVTVRVGQGKVTRALPLEFAAGASTTVPGLPQGPGLPPGIPGASGPLPPEMLPPAPQVTVTPPRRAQGAASPGPAVASAGATAAQPPAEPARK